MSSSAVELEPWVLLLGKGEATTLAIWRISHQQQDALAMFSSCELAEQYAESHYTPPWQPQQLQQDSLVRVFVRCYQQGLHFATLNPTSDSSRQVFVLKDVLRAAREDQGKPRLAQGWEPG